MKSLIVILSLAYTTAFSQTKQDYENFMFRFQNFYNANQIDSLCNLGSDGFGEIKNILFKAGEIADYKKDYGDIMSYQYITIDTVSDKKKSTIFKVYCSKKTTILAVNLNENNKFEHFNFHKSSPYTRTFLLKE